MLAALFLAQVLPLSAASSVAGEIVLQGKVLGQGAPCVRFRLSSGETISLQGASPQQFKKGMAVHVTGHWLAMSVCMQGRAFLVKDYKKL